MRFGLMAQRINISRLLPRVKEKIWRRSFSRPFSRVWLWRNFPRPATGIGRWTKSLVVPAVLAAMVIGPGVACAPAADKNAENRSAPSKARQRLVWPAPPEKPRIAFLRTLSGAENPNAIHRRAWLDKHTEQPGIQRNIAMVRPVNIAIDSHGRIYVVDSHKSAVFIFDPQNNSVRLLEAQGRGQLKVPYGIAIDQNDNVYISDTKLGQVNIYDSQGNITAALTAIDGVALVGPAGLAVDNARHRLLIADTRGHRIYAADLTHLGKGTSFGSHGSGVEEFNFPTAIAVDRTGNILVADTLNFCIKVYDKDFKFIRRIGEHGNAPGTFDRPKGVSVDSEGHIYVVDAAFSNFQVFTPEGKLLLFVGSFGMDVGMFRLPTGIYIDKEDRIYVADTMNRRVQAFQFVGKE